MTALQVFAKYKSQFNVDLGGEHGRTALHFAAIHDHDKCARVLVSLGVICTYVIGSVVISDKQ